MLASFDVEAILCLGSNCDWLLAGQSDDRSRCYQEVSHGASGTRLRVTPHKFSVGCIGQYVLVLFLSMVSLSIQQHADQIRIVPNGRQLNTAEGSWVRTYLVIHGPFFISHCFPQAQH